MLKKYIEAGKVVGTHGVRGEMRVQPWCDSPDFLIDFKKLYLDNSGEAHLDVVSSRVHGNICLIKADGVDTIESAESLRGKVLYIDRADAKLEEGRYFVDDIIGCTVSDAVSGVVYGKVTEVSNTGANDVWHITNGKNEYLMPNIPQFVDTVDVENEKITVTPIKGIFDDED